MQGLARHTTPHAAHLQGEEEQEEQEEQQEEQEQEQKQEQEQEEEPTQYRQGEISGERVRDKCRTQVWGWA
jgi:hypothetical protein